MEINLSQLKERVYTLSECIGANMFIFKNPITNEINIIGGTTSTPISFTPARVQINDYHEVKGKDITNIITDEWLHYFPNNQLNREVIEQKIDSLKPLNVKLPRETKWFELRKY